MKDANGAVRNAKSLEEFNRLKASGAKILLDRLPFEYTKAHIEVIRPDVWEELKPFKDALKHVIRRDEGWEKIQFNQSQRSDLFEILSSGSIKPDAEAAKAIKFLLGLRKKDEVKPPSNKSDVKTPVKKEEVKAPCPAELVPGRPQCKVKGCTWVHSNLKKKDEHKCPYIKEDPLKNEAKVDGKTVMKVNGMNAFALVYYPAKYFKTLTNESVPFNNSLWQIGGAIYFENSEAGNKLIEGLELTGTCCWVKKHFVTANHVFVENAGKRLMIFDHAKRALYDIGNERSLVDRDIAIFTVENSEFMGYCNAQFGRNKAVTVSSNSVRGGVTLVKVDHSTKIPYCETGRVIDRDDEFGELIYDVSTTFGDSGCIVYDSENGTVVGIHKGIHVKGKTNKCQTFMNEHIAGVLHMQIPSEKSLN